MRKTSHTCLLVPPVQNALSHHEWTELQSLARAVETTKYSKEVAGTLLGGPLWLRMAERMGQTKGQPLEQTSSSSNGNNNAKNDFNIDNNEAASFYFYAAPYQTMLSVLAAIGEAQPTVAKGLPSHGSAIMIELYDRLSTPGADYFVKLFYKPDGDNINVTSSTDDAIQLGTVFSSAKSKSMECPLMSFLAYIDNQIAANDWCRDCNNDSVDICSTTTPSNPTAAEEKDREDSRSSLTSSSVVLFAMGAFPSTGNDE